MPLGSGQTVVVGAGVTGLTVALQLARAGREVTVLERAPVVGGLARSFRYGPFLFDVGPHRFHTDDAAVEAFVRSALGAETTEIARRSAVHAFGRLLPWPLRPAALARLPPRVMARAAADLLARREPAGASFEAEIVARYGRTLYDAFFAPYTARFTGVPPAELHRDWARAGVDRAVIVRAQRPEGLRSLLLKTMLPAAREARFLYPRGGIGRFAERLALAAAEAGARVRTGCAVERMELDGVRIAAVASGGERFACDAVVWTGPLTVVAALLGTPAPGLRFRSTVLYNLELLRPPRFDQQWVYFADDAPFVRISSPGAFSPESVPPGRGSLCVESACWEGDAVWTNAESRVGEVVDALVRTGALASGADVLAAHVERVPDSYPVYALDYPEWLRAALEALRPVRNLVVAGRCGRFWYNNMDHSIAQGLRVAEQLLAGESPASIDPGDREFWKTPPPSTRG